MDEPFDEQEAVNRERCPSDCPEYFIECDQVIAAETIKGCRRPQNRVQQKADGCMVDQHRDTGDDLENAAIEDLIFLGQVIAVQMIPFRNLINNYLFINTVRNKKRDIHS